MSERERKNKRESVYVCVCVREKVERIPQGPIYAKDILLASWIFANVDGDDVDDDDNDDAEAR